MGNIKIGFFSIKKESGTTKNAIHLANYLAESENFVSIVETKNNKDPQFSNTNGKKQKDGTFLLNNVRYYPAETESVPNENIIVYDFGPVNYLQDFSGMDKLYLCTKPTEEELVDIMEFLADTGVDCEILLLGASKEQLNNFRKTNRKCKIIPDKKEKRCSYELATSAGLFLRLKGIEPPIVQNDKEYEELIFNYVEESIEEKRKFSFLGGKRKNSSVQTKPIEEDISQKAEEKVEEPKVIYEPIEVLDVKKEEKIDTVSQPFQNKDFVEVPKPKFIAPKKEEPSKAEEEMEISNKEENLANNNDIKKNTEPENKEKNTDETDNVKKSQEDKIEKTTIKPEEKAEQNLFVEDVKVECEKKENEESVNETSSNLKFSEQMKAKKNSFPKFSFSGFKPLFAKKEKPNDEKYDVPTIEEAQVPIERKEKIKPVTKQFIGKLSIFVTSLRHGCGSSYTAGSLATSLAELYNRETCLIHKPGTNMPIHDSVFEVTKDEDLPKAYNTGIMIHDRGIFNELTELEKSDMYRSDIYVLVSSGEESDISKLAKFIYSEGGDAEKWIYVFNHILTKKKEREIKNLMQDFNYIILPVHDYSNPPKELIKEWKNVINKHISSL